MYKETEKTNHQEQEFVAEVKVKKKDESEGLGMEYQGELNLERNETKVVDETELESKAEELKDVESVEGVEFLKDTEIIKATDDEFLNFKLEDIKPLEYETKRIVSYNGEASDVRLINTEKSGKRMVLKSNVVENLDLEGNIQIGFIDNSIIMSKEGLGKVSYHLKESGKTMVVYNSQLIEEITSLLALDFTNKVNFSQNRS